MAFSLQGEIEKRRNLIERRKQLNIEIDEAKERVNELLTEQGAINEDVLLGEIAEIQSLIDKVEAVQNGRAEFIEVCRE